MALTIDYWIKVMSAYPSGTLVRLIGGAICFENPDGTPAGLVGGHEEDQDAGIKS